MREYFVELLKNLKRLTGLKQYEEIASMPDKVKAQFELDELIMPMIRVCNTFSYIPDADKKKIIQNKLIEDPELYSLNAKKIYQWLNSASARYYGESHHVEVNKIEQVNQEPWKPETTKMVEDFMNSLRTGLTTAPIAGVEKEMEKIKFEDQQRTKPKSVSAGVSYTHDPFKEKLFRIYRRKAKENPYITNIKQYEIEGIKISAQNQDEANDIYTELITEEYTNEKKKR